MGQTGKGKGKEQGREYGQAGSRRRGQGGFSVWTLLVVVVFVIGVALPAVRSIPSLVEYFSVKRAASYAKQRAVNKREVVEYFDKQAVIDRIAAVKGEDLLVREDENGNIRSVDFSYRTEVPVYGPLSLLITYSGTQH
ncbi:DUF4845 domain-containing protein [Cupriavidus oxalaticus]|jgi:hypothetical protein|uniref:DUF4845 domain-containing protein n=1 Tax=Cupriavidus oxalaticus TaxID=96344 RepID=A0A375G1F7_9BURK|nr:DUF4845 domain-containing protein [Cupriavidus oxalaticus]QEZ47248.1 DUF4845 domain-containing protein [Cupriavidus oxalaticus]QRQ88460.1 DUF4845 domain-containing protein [Cupriavidus oxalaticus]QRQ93213.1 DUF4845 domain-containing protein [Cupriavidus oxalaticus]WQD81826.1 DUF4845 domain-containing protein [Cupriavidus oxalaticus]SPC13204.1 conserved hypothetical protein [Cupriavidus oxalaticus]